APVPCYRRYVRYVRYARYFRPMKIGLSSARSARSASVRGRGRGGEVGFPSIVQVFAGIALAPGITADIEILGAHLVLAQADGQPSVIEWLALQVRPGRFLNVVQPFKDDGGRHLLGVAEDVAQV